VGIYGFNSHAFVETIFAALQAAPQFPVNVNYRYVEAELAPTCFDKRRPGRASSTTPSSRRASPRVRDALPDAAPPHRDRRTVPGTDTSAIGSVDYEAGPRGPRPPERDFGERSDDDIYILYTGGNHRDAQGRRLAPRRRAVACSAALVNFDTGVAG